MLLPHAAVIALVDGQNFELYRNAGDEAEPALTALDSPKLDASNHSASAHHSVPGNHANRQVSEDAHAIAATHWLNTQVLDGSIKALVIFASPKTLGEMRRHYHKLTEQAVIEEFNKDYVGKALAEIVAALRAKN
ncbi:host attachment protein [Novosphingobium sp.]|uniref:host attachment protein n=1 Tax=Novosphingobium sp. TaxID=1874826 RepID=UPI00286AA770|nr:host attachment protein [Novosphingobium sp.]